MVGADDGDKIKINSAFRIGPLRKEMFKPSDVIVQFCNWTAMKIIMKNFRQYGTVEVEGLEVQAFRYSSCHITKKETT